MKYTGNIITPDGVFFGELLTDTRFITAINEFSAVREDADWICAGFIDIHTHGLENYTADSTDGTPGMAECAVKYGVTAFCPTLSCNSEKILLEQLFSIKESIAQQKSGAKIAGIHMEGPWLNPLHCGGMAPEMIRGASVAEAEKYLAAADGTLKIMTIAPEMPGADEVIKLLTGCGVRVSAGHTGLLPENYESAIAAGIRQFCHLFDTYALPEDHGGVRQAALTDLALCDDRTAKEIIMDGCHVPPELVILARRAAGAENIIAITDSLQGAGLEYGRFYDPSGWYIIKAGDVARREADNVIVGSSLTMNRAFYNMVSRFGFTPQEASLAASANPAAALGLSGITGSLQTGLLADITVLAPNMLTVKSCHCAK